MSAILAVILDFSTILFFAKLQQILLELVENMFLASNTKIIENSFKKKKIRTNFPKILQLSILNFNLHN